MLIYQSKGFSCAFTYTLSTLLVRNSQQLNITLLKLSSKYLHIKENITFKLIIVGCCWQFITSTIYNSFCLYAVSKSDRTE
ncbi:hypothetical protein EB796_015951 [Bugula neritina]|uniref:Uncharacterized protein n=1 Tax=Bugula neritina TaxID=10212 RepID=A0A7J7JHG6_BUGNE|nr:hypothetical protein EB796_015951 [Bugula neritina]